MKAIKLVWLTAILLLFNNFVFAQSWTQTSAPITNWTSMACSGDGNKLIAAANGGVGPGPYYIIAPGSIYISTNSGVTWTQATNAPTADWTSVASSADGNRLTAAASGGGIWRSVDSGFTWLQTGALSNNWVSVASSADGKKLNALARVFPPPDFYTSSDSGNNWTTNASPYDRWVAIASSADGNKLVACGALGTVLASTNSGKSWRINTINSGSLSGVATSADGGRLLLAGSGGIYLSVNSGLNWFKIMNAPPAGYIASSADGSKLVATGWVGYNTNFPIYISTDFGGTWLTNISPSAIWSSVVSSADGTKLAATINGTGGGIWTAQLQEAPRLNFSFSNGNAVISWTIPSTCFVLQQSADLVSWADVTNAPALNLSNLQNEIFLSPTNTSGFYRLATP
jgi:hypothetical protein